MSAVIELSQTNSAGVLAIDLIDLLQVVPEAHHKLVWAILDLEAIGDISEVWEAGIVDLETQISSSPIILNWQDLVKLANLFDQVINLTLVACLNAADIPAVDFDMTNSACELAFELVDSTVWRIFARREDTLDAFVKPLLQSAA
ncbi:hypothetical protein [Leptolyngbya sp. FACHB-17]|uniref:hypothetical protein n=1 Tax=unclassified Leptolyngbya TaxID=2650499 RepID=UPI001680BC27|nr:hypothetical protein [Leptolyngbya sp. FACHB-17]MBD2079025.1 hypothetical protein [Leptolyngbya sp. FACHB-17]